MNVFDEARDIIWGDREEAYGDPAINLRRIAGLWSAYLYGKAQGLDAGVEVSIEEEDVAWMMVLVKMSRQTHKPKRDNLVDAIGYIGLLERMACAKQAAAVDALGEEWHCA